MRFWLPIALVFAAGEASAQPAPRISIEDFAAFPVLRSPTLSPDGKRIVARADVEGSTHLVLLNADDPSAAPRRIAVGKTPITAIHWAGNERLLLEVAGSGDVMGIAVTFGRLLVVDLPTGAARLADRKSRGIYGGDVLFVSEGGLWAVVASQDGVFDTPSVKRVDLATGEATVIEKARSGVWDWFVDDAGVVRGGVSYDERRWKFWYRSKAGEPFRTISGKLGKDDSAVDRFFFSRDGEQGTIVTNERNGRFGVYRYNYATAEIGETVFEHPRVDISDVMIDPRTREISGVRYHDERSKMHWLDPKLKAVQARIDKALPGADNAVLGDPTTDNRMLIKSAGASSPGTYFLFDQAKRTMSPVIQLFDRIDANKLAEVRPASYRSRDGLEVPAYVTLPRGKEAKRLPLIVLPHGGPFSRDEWEYDPLVQLLANRGYAVLQPQFRGSTGYGKDYVASGYGQWGRKMQDDLDDGVDWLASKGQIDPSRVCIVGASYGGYAALWGAIRNPERYRCAASLAGVTDLRSQLRDNRRSFSATRYYRQWRSKVRGEDKIDLKTVSPLAQAARLKVPVLIAHGELDGTVAVGQGRQMVAAIERSGGNVTSVFYKDSGHDFSSSKDLEDFLRRLEAFLAKHNPA
jgi:dipeptidyl aminopeptidase/acylaminoacyl peptidase